MLADGPVVGKEKALLALAQTFPQTVNVKSTPRQPRTQIPHFKANKNFQSPRKFR
jgi:hypothetical protein